MSPISSSSPSQVTPSPRAIACVLLSLSLLLVCHAAKPLRAPHGEKSHGKKFVSPAMVGQKSDDWKEFNVLSYGARGDGRNPDSKAFLQAWEAACNTMGSTRMIVPKDKTFLVEPMFFNGGQCKADSIDVQIQGKIVAPGSISAWDGRSRDHWLGFLDGRRLTIGGGGSIEGQGPVWWKCKQEKRCGGAPAALYVAKGDDVSISNLNFVDSQGVHMKVVFSKNIRISNVQLTAPAESPHTDGINLGTNENVQISSSNIQTGDDCVAIIGTSRGINITDVKCGPGHGISIGSLGNNGDTDNVQDVYVKNAHFYRADNGVRIKTWQGGRGLVKNVVYEQLNFTETRNPIIIDQFYCPRGSCPEKSGGVKIEDVRVIGASGTTPDDIAINLKCSKSMCTGLHFRGIDLRSSDPKKTVTSNCINSAGTSYGNVQPPLPCLKDDPTVKKSHHLKSAKRVPRR